MVNQSQHFNMLAIAEVLTIFDCDSEVEQLFSWDGHLIITINHPSSFSAEMEFSQSKMYTEVTQIK